MRAWTKARVRVVAAIVFALPVIAAAIENGGVEKTEFGRPASLSIEGGKVSLHSQFGSFRFDGQDWSMIDSRDASDHGHWPLVLAPESTEPFPGAEDISVRYFIAYPSAPMPKPLSVFPANPDRKPPGGKPAVSVIVRGKTFTSVFPREGRFGYGDLQRKVIAYLHAGKKLWLGSITDCGDAGCSDIFGYFDLERAEFHWYSAKEVPSLPSEFTNARIIGGEGFFLSMFCSDYGCQEGRFGGVKVDLASGMISGLSRNTGYANGLWDIVKDEEGSLWLLSLTSVEKVSPDGARRSWFIKDDGGRYRLMPGMPGGKR